MNIAKSSADVFSMRRCMILPITDSLGDSVGYKIYEELEGYIKRAQWCEYVPSSDVIEVFSRYRDKLPEYLDDEKVLQTVAERLKVGTLIRIKSSYEIDKMNLSLDVIGENGKDVYFSEKAVLNKIDILQAHTTIVNWLELYESNIPYDGKIIGVLGDQITFEYAQNKELAIGQEFKVKKFINKKKHPLLKKIVEWDSEVIAKGQISNLSRGQALGVIKVYTSKHPIKAGDWLRLEAIDQTKNINDRNFAQYEKQKFGRLGDLAISFLLSSNTVTTTAVTGNNKMNGFIYGLGVELETWITRNYFVLGEFSKKIGSLSKISGNPDTNSTGQNTTILKVAGGYKYLPMGFFYGPQVNFYAGYAKYSYTMDTSANDGFGENAMSGILVGVGGNIPVKKGLRIFASGEIIPFGEFTDETSIFGTTKNISSMVLEAGANYVWDPNIKLVSSFELVNNAGKFKGANSELKYSDTVLKVGASFSF